METGQGQISNKNVGESAFLYGLDSHPVYRPCINVVPVLTGHSTGIATGTSRLIKVETLLDQRTIGDFRFLISDF
jgi:hypothetical protein